MSTPPNTNSRPLLKPGDLSKRLIRFIGIPLVILLVVSSMFDYRTAQETTNSAHDAVLSDVVYDLENHLLEKKSDTVLDLSDEAEAMMRSSAPDSIYFAIIDQQGLILAGDRELPHFELPTTSTIEFHDSIYRGQAVRAAVHRLAASNNCIVVLQTTRKRQASRKQILTAMMLPNVGIIVACMLIVLLGVSRGLRPLRLVEAEIALRSPQDLSPLNVCQAPSEIRPMLLRLNDLFSVLAQAAEQQQRFIADAAHQLRTPLGGLQTQIDLAIADGHFSNDPGRAAQIEAALQRLAHLLAQLLTYARAEHASRLTEHFEKIPLRKVIEAVASQFIDASIAKNIDLSFAIEECEIDGLPWLIHEAVANLVDNAIRYTPAGGEVQVLCANSDAGPFIEVRDNGNGIPADRLGQIFERFFRVGNASGGNSDGCGLGLSIVREICSAHGASVNAENLPTGGACFRILFQLAKFPN